MEYLHIANGAKPLPILMRLETVNLNYHDYKLILVSTTFIESTALGVRNIS